MTSFLVSLPTYGWVARDSTSFLLSLPTYGGVARDSLSFVFCLQEHEVVVSDLTPPCFPCAQMWEGCGAGTRQGQPCKCGRSGANSGSGRCVPRAPAAAPGPGPRQGQSVWRQGHHGARQLLARYHMTSSNQDQFFFPPPRGGGDFKKDSVNNFPFPSHGGREVK